jgi:hypothetical protein
LSAHRSKRSSVARLRYGLDEDVAPPSRRLGDRERSMNENFSLIVMCLFLLGSLAFLAEQLTSYH